MPNYRKLNIDKAHVAEYVTSRLASDLMERQGWMDKRVERYAKIRGWLPTKDWPWPGSSNIWAPVITTAALRVQSAIYNAVMSFRPVIHSKALKAKDMPKEKRIDNLLDWQMFVEQDGANLFDDFSTNFVLDGTAFAFARWVKTKQTVVEVRIFDATGPEDFLQVLQSLYPSIVAVKQLTDDGFSFRVEFDETSGRADFYERDDERFEVHLQREVVAKDGPALIVEHLEDIVAPIGSSNLQPITPDNPHGSPYVNRLGKATIDEIRRKFKSKEYELMTKDDMNEIENTYNPTGPMREDQRMEEERFKDQGLQPTPAETPENLELRPLQIIEHYGRWDVNGDGLEEDVIFWVAKDAKRLLSARYLTELYPGIPIRRPFAEARFIPVPGQLYGVGLPELVEPLYDVFKTLLDASIDWGEVRNTPFFFYRSSSSLQPEVIRLAPGEGYPLDNPQTDISFPKWGNENNTWTLTMMGMVQQMIERLSMVSDVQLGRVPTGKASALRTVGTTMALLQQGDVRSEQVLRRFFTGLKTVYGMFHNLNKAHLSPEKEIRVVGTAKPGEHQYLRVAPQDIDVDVDFQFKATMLNTNRAALGQSLTETMGVLISPLALQLGLVDAETAYNLFTDYVEARDQDADRYIKAPTPTARGPKILAEEAIDSILSGEIPQGTPLEDPQEHLQKLIQFQSSESFGFLNPIQINIWKSYLRQVMEFVQQAQQQAKLQEAAGALSGQQSGANGGPGGVESAVQEPELPEVQNPGPGELPEGA